MRCPAVPLSTAAASSLLISSWKVTVSVIFWIFRGQVIGLPPNPYDLVSHLISIRLFYPLGCLYGSLTGAALVWILTTQTNSAWLDLSGAQGSCQSRPGAHKVTQASPPRQGTQPQLAHTVASLFIFILKKTTDLINLVHNILHGIDGYSWMCALQRCCSWLESFNNLTVNQFSVRQINNKQ